MCAGFRLHLAVHIDFQKSTALDFQAFVNRIDKERKLPATVPVGLGGALDLLRRKADSYLCQRFAGFFKIDVKGLLQFGCPRG